MASLVTLRELDTHEREDQPLLKRFEQCRHDVVRVSATSILQDCIAVTTKGGFVELINIDTGAFRLFLSHLGDTPLDSLLRCFSLVPALYAAKGGHHLLYSLAYSNELLLADMEKGRVEVLARFHSRPSVVFCDGDYMACGEGCGQVALWRAPSDTTEAKLLWRRSVFSDTVMCISVQCNYVFCSSADYHCYVLSLDSGEMAATLPHEPAPAVALQSIAGSQVNRSLTVLCLPNTIFLYSPPPLIVEDASAKPMANSDWTRDAVLRLDVQISCASCCAGLMALGTASGVVLLLKMSATSDEVVERVRFDVGFSVVSMQIFANGSLVVVTSAGDVWKWAIDDLLPWEDNKEEEDGKEEEDEEEAENLIVPQPYMQPIETQRGTRMMAMATGTRAASESGKDLEGMGDAEDEIVVEMNDEAFSSASSLLSMSCHSVQQETDTDNLCHQSGRDILEERNSALLFRLSAEKDIIPDNPTNITTNGSGVAAGDTFGITPVDYNAEAIDSEGKSPSVDVTAAVITDNEKDDDHDHNNTGGGNGHGGGGRCSEQSFQPSSISIVAGTLAATETAQTAYLPPSNTCPNMDHLSVPHVDDSTAPSNVEKTVRYDGTHLKQKDGVMVTTLSPARNSSAPRSSTSPVSSHALQCVLRETDLGPPPVITGLRAGRRMDPRKARHIVENGNTNVREEALLSKPEIQSSKMLVDYRQALEEAKFDYKEYTKAHPFKVESLKYRYPVKLPVHGLHAQVFAAAESRLQDRPDDNVESPGNNDKRKQQRPITDDLMSITFQKFTRRKDAALEEERRRGGPEIRRHLCDSLLYNPVNPSDTVLFQETSVQLAMPNMVLIPMPLPPTPSVL